VASAHGGHPFMLRWPSWQLAASHCGSVEAAWLAPASSRGGFRQHRTSEKATDAENSRRLARMEDEHSNLKWTATGTDRSVTGLYSTVQHRVSAQTNKNNKKSQWGTVRRGEDVH
jgi:hypothetical protein